MEKKGDKDWARANGISMKDNGNYIFSMRNFNAFFEIDPKSVRIVKEYRLHINMREPTPHKNGFVLGDRNCTGTKKSDQVEKRFI